MRRHPPDILITTPESLYLILTSQAREMLTDVEAVIVDEIHAVAGTKRGAHLALTLERLAALQRAEPQRIGLSATQNPLEEVGRFLVGPRRTVHDRRRRRPQAARPEDPGAGRVDGRARAATRHLDPLDPLAGGEATRRSIWPAIYPQLLELVSEHRSTIVFVNNRRSAERLALRLNELANADAPTTTSRQEIARAHHGSLAREERTVVEELLKAGELPCLVATSSLELGIDMGAVDLVLQVESPKSVARGLQRIGRAGHGVGDTSKGRIFPKFRADLLECAVVTRLMREGKIEPTVVPRNALDVLAQHIVAIAAAAEPEPVGVDDLLRARHAHVLLRRAAAARCSRTSSTCSTAATRRRVRRAAAAHRVGPRRRHDPRAQGRAPARGHERRHDPRPRPVHGHAARRPQVGELDEEMVYEARPGQTFLLGASTWRIEEIGRDRVIVTPAPGAPGRGAVLEGRQRRPAEGARARRSARSAAGRSTRTPPRCSSATTTSTRSPRRTSLDFLREQQDGHARRAERPHDRRRALPRRDRRLARCASSRRTAAACTPRGRWR